MFILGGVIRNASRNNHKRAIVDSAKLGAARRRKIVDLVEGRGSVAVGDLSKEFGVSEATIRRDLRELGETGAVTRTHGGVLNNASAFVDLPNDERIMIRSAEKRLIGRAAIELLEGDEIVFLDAGTTALAVAKNAHLKPNCRYVTTCLTIASQLRDQGISNFYLIGGAYICVNDSFGGRLAISAIRTLSFDIAFLCCSSIDLAKKSISIGDEDYSQIQAEVVASSRRNCVVAHHEKIDAGGFIRTASFDSIDCLVTDSGINEGNRQLLESAGIAVVRA